MLVTILLVSAGTACIDDSFQHPLSDAGSSKPEPRLVGTWVLETWDEPCRLAIEVDPRVAGRLLVSVGTVELMAQTLTLGERQFLFVRRRQAAEHGFGWLLEYEHAENGPPTARLLDRGGCSRAVRAKKAKGSFAYPYTGRLFPWFWFIWQPALDLDAEQTRRWLETRKETVVGPPGPLGQRLLQVVEEPMNAVIKPGGDLALKPEPCDPMLLGESVFRNPEPHDEPYTVEATDDPAVLRWSVEDPDFGNPRELLATEIDGVPYLTVKDDGPAGDHWIFRYEFVDDDTLAIIPPAPKLFGRAVQANMLSGEAKKEMRPNLHASGWLVTSSTEELRAFVSERGDECFPDRQAAPIVLNFKRHPARPK